MMIKVPYGINKENKLITAAETAVNGLACECTCPVCGERLVANKGNIRDPYFSHYSSPNGTTSLSGCTGTGMTLLHKLAQTIFEERKTIMLPNFKGYSTPVQKTYDEVCTEYRFGKKYADNWAQSKNYDGSCDELLVEFKVTHEVDEEKKKEIINYGKPCIEIFLTSLNQNSTKEEIRSFIEDNATNRRWLLKPVEGIIVHKEQDMNKAEVTNSEEDSRSYYLREAAYDIQSFIDGEYPPCGNMSIDGFMYYYRQNIRHNNAYAEVLDNYYTSLFSNARKYPLRKYPRAIEMLFFKHFDNWYEQNKMTIIKNQLDLALLNRLDHPEEIEYFLELYCYARIITYYNKNFLRESNYYKPNDDGEKIKAWEIYREMRSNGRFILRSLSPRYNLLLSSDYNNYKSLNEFMLEKGFYHLYERNITNKTIPGWVIDYKERKAGKIRDGKLKDINNELDDLYKIIFES